MLWILLAIQPVAQIPASSAPEKQRVVHVDLLIINQYCQTSDENGRTKTRVTWYSSFWDVHMMPPWGMCRVPVFEHRGWEQTKPLHQCDGGWSHEYIGQGNRRVLVTSATVLYLVSEFDFEYRNREWCRWLE